MHPRINGAVLCFPHPQTPVQAHDIGLHTNRIDNG